MSNDPQAGSASPGSTPPLMATVAWSPAARSVRLFQVSLPIGATVQDALDESGIWSEFPQGTDPGSVGIAVWGRRAALSQALRPGDRIEVCRPLRVDPKTARRERFARQGARASGLFAKSRGVVVVAEPDPG